MFISNLFRKLLLIFVVISIVNGRCTQNSINHEDTDSCDNGKDQETLSDQNLDDRHSHKPLLTGLSTKRPLLIHRIFEYVKNRRNGLTTTTTQTTSHTTSTPFSATFTTTKRFIKNKSTPFSVLPLSLKTTIPPAVSSTTTTTATNPYDLTLQEEEILESHLQKFELNIKTPKDKKKAAAQLYQTNLKILEHNQQFELGHQNFNLSLNQFSHFNTRKFVKISTGLIPLAERSSTNVANDLPEACQDLPAYKNWIEEGKVSRVKNQQNCSSSYLLTAISALESAAAIEYGSEAVELSTQHFLNCMRDGCKGGRPEPVWRNAKENGGLVPSLLYYNYSASSNRFCVENLRRDPKTTVERWQRVPEGNEELMKCRVARFGPVFAGMTLPTLLTHYQSGIFDDPSGECTNSKPVDHAVLIVGYGTEKNRQGVFNDFWLAQNTWGSTWGDEGLFKIVRGKGLCNIATDVISPIVKPPVPRPLKISAFTNLCDKSGTIFSSNTQNKTFCIIETEQNYVNARTSCERFGMQLFQADSDISKESISNFVSKFYFSQRFFVKEKTLNGCMTLKKVNGRYTFLAGDCSSPIYYICEYETTTSPRIVPTMSTTPRKALTTKSTTQSTMSTTTPTEMTTNFGPFPISAEFSQTIFSYFPIYPALTTSHKIPFSSVAETTEQSKPPSKIQPTETTFSQPSTIYQTSSILQITDEIKTMSTSSTTSEIIQSTETTTSSVQTELDTTKSTTTSSLSSTTSDTTKSTETTTSSPIQTVSESTKSTTISSLPSTISETTSTFTVKSTDTTTSFAIQSVSELTTTSSIPLTTDETTSISTTKSTETSTSSPIQTVSESTLSSTTSFSPSKISATTSTSTTKSTDNTKSSAIQSVSESTKLTTPSSIPPTTSETTSITATKSADTPKSSPIQSSSESIKITTSTLPSTTSATTSTTTFIDTTTASAIQTVSELTTTSSIPSTTSETTSISTTKSTDTTTTSAIQSVSELTTTSSIPSTTSKTTSISTTESAETTTTSAIRSVSESMKLTTSPLPSITSDTTKSTETMKSSAIQTVSELTTTSPLPSTTSETTSISTTKSVDTTTSSVIQSVSELTTTSSIPSASETTSILTTKSVDSTTSYPIQSSSESIKLTTTSTLPSKTSEATSILTTKSAETTKSSAIQTVLESTKLTTTSTLLSTISETTSTTTSIDTTKSSAIQTVSESTKLTTTSSLPSTTSDTTSTTKSTTSVAQTFSDTTELQTSIETTSFQPSTISVQIISDTTTTKLSTLPLTFFSSNVTSTTTPQTVSNIFTFNQTVIDAYVCPDCFYNDEPLDFSFLSIHVNNPNTQGKCIMPKTIKLYQTKAGPKCCCENPIGYLYEEVKNTFDRLKHNNLLFTPDVFTLASQIQDILNSTLSDTYFELFTILKSQLPKSVQILIWGLPANLVNEEYQGEYLTADSTSNHGRRFIFSKNLSESEKHSTQSQWHFSTFDDGKKFLIRNIWSNEYIYPDDQKDVFAWSLEAIDWNFFWNVEILSDDKIRLKSSYYNEYLSAENGTVFSSGRRVITEFQCGRNCNWLLKN